MQSDLQKTHAILSHQIGKSCDALTRLPAWTQPIPGFWRILQHDATLTAQDIGAVLNLSPSQAARRRQRLEQDGVITGYRATVAPDRIGLGVEAFIQVVDGRPFRRRTPAISAA